MKMAEPAVKKAPTSAPTSPAPSTTPVECERLIFAGATAAGAAGAGSGAEVRSGLVLCSSVVMWLPTSSLLVVTRTVEAELEANLKKPVCFGDYPGAVDGDPVGNTAENCGAGPSACGSGGNGSAGVTTDDVGVGTAAGADAGADDGSGRLGVDVSCGGSDGSSMRIFQVTPVTAKTASAPSAAPASAAPITTPVEWLRRGPATPIDWVGCGIALVSAEVMWLPCRRVVGNRDRIALRMGP